jgi:hypothetical protein
MDVDENPPASSGVKRTFLSSRTSSESYVKHIKLDLPGSQLATVNEKMNAEMEFWGLPQSLESHPKLTRLLPWVVFHLTGELAQTDANVDEMGKSQAKNLVESFTPEELDEWANGLRNVMEIGLIWLHIVRTFHIGRVGGILMITTAKLRRNIKMHNLPLPKIETL